jgi:hypothetical protein
MCFRVLGLNSSRLVNPGDWARIVHRALKEQVGDLSHLTELGSHYLSHLIIACKFI